MCSGIRNCVALFYANKRIKEQDSRWIETRTVFASFCALLIWFYPIFLFRAFFRSFCYASSRHFLLCVFSFSLSRHVVTPIAGGVTNSQCLREYCKLAMSWVKEFSNCMKDVFKAISRELVPLLLSFFHCLALSISLAILINRATKCKCSVSYSVIERTETWNEFRAGSKIY